MPKAIPFVSEALRLLRYSLVGGAALIVHAAIAFGLILWTNTPATIAHFLGFSAGFLISVQGHIRFTFRTTASQIQAHRRFFIVCAVALVISELALVGMMSGLGWEVLWAQAAAIGVSCAVSYPGSRFWAFKPAAITPLRTDPPGVGRAA